MSEVYQMTMQKMSSNSEFGLNKMDYLILGHLRIRELLGKSERVGQYSHELIKDINHMLCTVSKEESYEENPEIYTEFYSERYYKIYSKIKSEFDSITHLKIPPKIHPKIIKKMILRRLDYSMIFHRLHYKSGLIFRYNKKSPLGPMKKVFELTDNGRLLIDTLVQQNIIMGMDLISQHIELNNYFKMQILKRNKIFKENAFECPEAEDVVKNSEENIQHEPNKVKSNNCQRCGESTRNEANYCCKCGTKI